MRQHGTEHRRLTRAIRAASPGATIRAISHMHLHLDRDKVGRVEATEEAVPPVVSGATTHAILHMISQRLRI
jgi:hypothetical protein